MNSFFDEPTSPDGAQSDDQTSPIRQQFPRQSTSSDFFNEPIPRDDDTSSLSRFRDSSIFDNPRLEPKSKKFRGNTTEPTLEEILNPGGMFKGKRVDETDTQAIMRLWISERAAPEVLIWQAELMDRFQKNLINKASPSFLQSDIRRSYGITVVSLTGRDANHRKRLSLELSNHWIKWHRNLKFLRR
jgi:hypothetical protein